MIIRKELKFVTFEYDIPNKQLVILDSGDGVASMSRTNMFSLARFILRIAQKGKKRVKKTKK